MYVSEELGFSYGGSSNHSYVVPGPLKFGVRDKIRISGKSGMGKSTFLAMLSGLRGFHRGEIQYDFGGKSYILNTQNWSDNSGPKLWENIGFAFQRPELVNSLSVRSNMELALGPSADEVGRELFFGEFENGTEWDHVAQKLPAQLSGGQRQRVGLARAFGDGQSLVFVDEPTNNLDVENRQRIVDFLTKRSEEIALVVVSHDEEFLSSLNVNRRFNVEISANEIGNNGVRRLVETDVAGDTFEADLEHGAD